MKQFAIIAAMLASTGLAFAAGNASKPAKPVVCAAGFTTAKTPDGAEIGICGAASATGKARMLRTFAIVSVVNPATERAERVMVGFQ